LSFARFEIRPTSVAALAAGGILTPTPVQEETIPLLLQGRDVVVQAHTGSGKTLAFGLPLVERCDPELAEPQALILTPTRELAIQVSNVLTEIGGPAGLSVALLYGGVGYQPQIDALLAGAQLVVGTPGRVLDHLERRTLRLGALRVLVLDEADQMLDRGFAPDVERIIRATPPSRQTALLSATTPDWVKQVAAKHLREPAYLTVEPEEAAPDIEHTVIQAWDGDKMSVLLRLLSQPVEGSTLVFGRTRHGVMNLGSRLRRLGYHVEVLQGDLGQAVRERILERFRSGEVPILLATNVAARGLDMLNIERVINYDLPDTPELFVHRVGRTGRMGRSGKALTIIAAADLPMMKEIERHIGRKLPSVPASRYRDLPIAAPAATNGHKPAPALAHGNGARPEPRPAGEGAATGNGAAPKRRRRRRSRGRSTAPVTA
jgi:superfamily II DNA/RNA helicase